VALDAGYQIWRSKNFGKRVLATGNIGALVNAAARPIRRMADRVITARSSQPRHIIRARGARRVLMGESAATQVLRGSDLSFHGSDNGMLTMPHADSG